MIIMTDDRHITSVALDCQLDLLRYYTRNEFGRKYADAVIESALGDTPMESMGVKLHELTLIGETYAVSEEIIDVLEFAAATIPVFKIEESDLPSQAGFVWLERPIVIKDVRDEDLVVKAFGWRLAITHSSLDEYEAAKEIRQQSPALGAALDAVLEKNELPGKALAVLIWTDPADTRDHMYPEWQAEFESREEWDEHVHTLPQTDMLSLLSGVWRVGEEMPEDWTKGHPSSLNFGKFVLGFLRFINEPWVDFRQMVPSRHQRKRVSRAKIEPPAVHIVQLRRALHHGPAPEKGEGFEYSHRWLVRGHWRMQACGPGRTERRPRWITEHIKGPDDKPLVVHDKVFSVDR